MLKDPLQRSKNPYEMLGIDQTADSPLIKEALKRSVRPGCDVVGLRTAMNTLLKPEERVLEDLFIYSDRFLKQLVPRVTSNRGKLLNNRQELARAWSKIEEKTFPNYAATHSLAVLWYWWAVYLEDSMHSYSGDVTHEGLLEPCEIPELNVVWHNTIMRWIFLANSEEFIGDWLTKNYSEATVRQQDPINIMNEVKQRLKRRLERSTIELQERYPALAERYHGYNDLFHIEDRTAKSLAENRVEITRGYRKYSISCGPLMLEQVGLFDEVAGTCRELWDETPWDEDLQKLVESFSPYVSIRLMVERKKYDEALDQIDSLTAQQQENEEVVALKARVKLEKGKQLFVKGRYQEGLDYWDEALEEVYGEDGLEALHDEVWETIKSKCQDTAINIKDDDLEKAIDIIERALQIIDDDDLETTLAGFYFNRGLALINEAMEKKEASEKIDQEYLKSEISHGIEDLERAAELDPESTYYDDQLEKARELLADVDFMVIYRNMKSGNWSKAIVDLQLKLRIDPVNNKAVELIESCYYNQAHQVYEDNKDIHKARGILLDGLSWSPNSEEIKKALSILLNRHGVELGDKAYEMASQKNISSAKSLYQEASNLISEALSYSPNDETIKKNLFMINTSLNNLKNNTLSRIGEVIFKIIFYFLIGLLIAWFKGLFK